jgi:hypothetical protein
VRRGGPLARRTPLRAKHPLVRKTPLTVKSKGAPRSGREAGVERADLPPKLRMPRRSRGHRTPEALRAALVKRSGGWCEVQLVDVCDGRATDFQHRVAQGNGGVHGAALAASDRLSNGLHCCRSCHRWIHANPEASQREFVGWSVRRGSDPARVPALYRGEVVYLSDDGSVASYEAVGT